MPITSPDINLEDYISLSSGKPNAEFERVMELFRARCGARLHWGKEGWTRHARCFDGAAEYPAGWCSFGCAVQVRGGAGKGPRRQSALPGRAER